MKNKTDILIIGAGIGGVGSAVWSKYTNLDFMVVEGGSELPKNLHNGVHYLHSRPSLPYNCKTNLKEVVLTDGILDSGTIKHKPDLISSLKYSEKVREIQHPSSIMDVGSRKIVYLPDNNNMNDYVEKMFLYAGVENFNFGFWLTKIDIDHKIATFQKDGTLYDVEYKKIISTIPLDVLRKVIPEDEFLMNVALESNPIYITNYRVEKIVPNWLINLYIPDQNTNIYRASILNGICSVESIGELTYFRDVPKLLNMFHFSSDDPTRFSWKTGKIVSLSKDVRNQIVQKLLSQDICTIGRFGQWDRKLLMDSTIEQAKQAVGMYAREIFGTSEMQGLNSIGMNNPKTFQEQANTASDNKSLSKKILLTRNTLKKIWSL